MENKHRLVHNEAEQRYEMEVEGHKALVEYTLQPGVIVITHTWVPQHLEGRGIASEMTRAVLTDIQEKQLQLIPQCQFTAQYIYRHPEWEALVLKEVKA